MGEGQGKREKLTVGAATPSPNVSASLFFLLVFLCWCNRVIGTT